MVRGIICKLCFGDSLFVVFSYYGGERMTIIQEEISVSEDFVISVINQYETMPIVAIGIFGKTYGKKEIIKEIKELSKVGKAILLMNYECKKFLKENTPKGYKTSKVRK